MFTVTRALVIYAVLLSTNILSALTIGDQKVSSETFPRKYSLCTTLGAAFVKAHAYAWMGG
jgi:hypothetical protein